MTKQSTPTLPALPDDCVPHAPAFAAFLSQLADSGAFTGATVPTGLHIAAAEINRAAARARCATYTSTPQLRAALQVIDRLANGRRPDGKRLARWPRQATGDDAMFVSGVLLDTVCTVLDDQQRAELSTVIPDLDLADFAALMTDMTELAQKLRRADTDTERAEAATTVNQLIGELADLLAPLIAKESQVPAPAGAAS